MYKYIRVGLFRYNNKHNYWYNNIVFMLYNKWISISLYPMKLKRPNYYVWNATHRFNEDDPDVDWTIKPSFFIGVKFFRQLLKITKPTRLNQ